jgi:hypothetical protein
MNSLVLALIIAIAVLALVTAGIGVWTALRGTQPRYDPLAQRLYVDSRLEEMTAATLAAMREAARRAGGGQ